MFGFFKSKKDKSETLVLSDKIFSNDVIPELLIGGKPNKIDVVRNVSFIHCKAGSSVSFFKGARLENVVFEEFNAGGELNFDSEVCLKHVKIIGKKYPKALIIQPREKGQKTQTPYGLDISEFHGEVNILGVDVTNVKVDEKRHVKLFLNRFENADIKERIPDSFDDWRIALRKMKHQGVEQAVFDVPLDKSDASVAARKNLDMMRELGLVD